MNNASKGRCVTVTPRGKARTKHLRQNPGFARGNIVPAARQKTLFTEDHKGHKDRFIRSNRGNGGFGGGANLGTAVVGFSPVFARTLSDFFAIFAIFRGYYCLFFGPRRFGFVSKPAKWAKVPLSNNHSPDLPLVGLGAHLPYTAQDCKW